MATGLSYRLDLACWALDAALSNLARRKANWTRAVNAKLTGARTLPPDQVSMWTIASCLSPVMTASSLRMWISISNRTPKCGR